ncbi:hypothetical protein ACFQZJ_06145 [Maribacter chungangensis]|uniref:Uncharacterized protein n=1 Tax=Maribacter chungangensis TaxID=1069117 RepID=A0ABW3B159_9FLAO
MNTRNLYLFTLLALLSLSSVFAQETITNKTVLEMQNLGFDDFMIIDKINTSDVKFDTSIKALSGLKKKGVSSEVISLMMIKSRQNTKSKTGIYFLSDDDELELIQPTVFSGTSNNSVAQKLVSGFINSKKKATLPKTRSSNAIRNNRPKFTFVFDPSSAGVDNMQTGQAGSGTVMIPDWWFRVASNPNEFVLIKLTVKDKKNLREVVVGKSSALTESQGIDPRFALHFQIEEIEGNKFEVSPDYLEPGEYAFMYQGRVPAGRDNQSVFDFSIQ